MTDPLQLLDKEQLELVLSSTGIGVWYWDVQTGETVFNERWANIIGYTLEEISPVSINTWMKYAYDEDLPGSEAAFKACWAGETDAYIYESRMHHKSGELIWVFDTGKVVEWVEPGVPRRMMGTHLDITQQKRKQEELKKARDKAELFAEELAELNIDLQAEIARRKDVESKLEQRAWYDYLTTLPNRANIFGQMNRIFAEAKRDGLLVAILFIDLDGFKKVNDQLGHDLGDAVLVEMSIRISDAVRDMDLVSRFGGDEFLVVLPRCRDRKEIDLVANRLLKTAAIPFDFIENDQITGISIGISIYPDDGDVFDQLVTRADKAMYQSKSSSTNKIHYHSP